MTRPRGMEGGGIRFDWKEVDCFLRPQSVLCDEIAPGYGLLLLFLASIYRAFAFDGFFTERDKQHFTFATSVFRALSGIEFTIVYVHNRADILRSLKERLRGGRPAILPANLRDLPYFRSYRELDQAHYFIITGFDEARRTFTIKDNLHLAEDNRSTEYDDHELTQELLADLTGQYWDTHVGGPRDTAHQETLYWILQIQPSGAFRRQEEGEVLALIVSEYQRLMERLEDPRTAHALLDDRHLAALQAVFESGDMDSLQRLIRKYLAECNFAGVYLKILLHGLRRSAAADLAPPIEEYQTAAAWLRSQILIKSLLPHGPSREEWLDVRTRLASLALRLRASIACRLGEPHRQVPVRSGQQVAP